VVLLHRKNGEWILENLTDKDPHSWSFEGIEKKHSTNGGLKDTMGWDTVDELLCKFYNWKVITDTSLHVKHLKPLDKLQ
jgi:hypothetical protein